MKIKDLLTDESKWTKYTLARDKHGDPVREDSPEALSFCLMGAIIKVYGDGEEAEKIKNRVVKAVNFLYCWNDSSRRTFKEVRELIEELDI